MGSAALAVKPLPDSKPVGGGDTAKSLRISGYPFSPFRNDWNEVWEWEAAAMGAGYAGHWKLTAR
jgi:hypothetical protein